VSEDCSWKNAMSKRKKFGYTHIYLESLPAFGKAISIYEKQGFEQLSAPLGNSGHTGCDIWMLKNYIRLN
jgi:putative acetyltransferase